MTPTPERTSRSAAFERLAEWKRRIVTGLVCSTAVVYTWLLIMAIFAGQASNLTNFVDAGLLVAVLTGTVAVAYRSARPYVAALATTAVLFGILAVLDLILRPGFFGLEDLLGDPIMDLKALGLPLATVLLMRRFQREFDPSATPQNTQ